MREVGLGLGGTEWQLRHREAGRDTETERDFHTRHVALTGAKGLQDELELPDSCSSLLSAAHFWLHHQLH